MKPAEGRVIKALERSEAEEYGRRLYAMEAAKQAYEGATVLFRQFTRHIKAKYQMEGKFNVDLLSGCIEEVKKESKPSAEADKPAVE